MKIEADDELVSFYQIKRILENAACFLDSEAKERAETVQVLTEATISLRK